MSDSRCPNPCPCPVHASKQERERKRKRKSRAAYMREYRKRRKGETDAVDRK